MTESSPPDADEDLVFICGALRSGTTLLRLMVNDHPALNNPGEMDFLFEPPPMTGGMRDMAAYSSSLAFNRVFAKLNLKLDPSLAYEDQVREIIRQLHVAGKRLSINIHRHFDRIVEIFPKARFVHLLRDPRDVAKSAIGMGWAGNVYHGVDHWIASERDFEKLASLVPSDRIYRMRNEALVRAPESELAKLCVFLGVPYDRRMLDYPTHTTYGSPDPNLAEQWRRDMSPRDLALIEGKVGAMLAARDYAASGVAPREPSIAERALLRLQNRAGRLRFSARRDGLAVTLIDIIARRLPLPGFADIARRRKAEAAARHVK